MFYVTDINLVHKFNYYNKGAPNRFSVGFTDYEITNGMSFILPFGGILSRKTYLQKFEDCRSTK